MRYTKRARSAMVAVVAVSTWIGGTLQATAAPPSDDGPSAATAAHLRSLPVAERNPALSLELLASLPPVVQQSTTVTIDPELEPGTPLIYTDGTVVPGQSEDAIEAAATCGGTAWGPPGGAWGAASTSGCGVWGYDSTARVSYRWWLSQAAFTTAQVQGWGYNSAKTGGWYGVGSGSNNYVGTTVPWGEVIAVPKLRARTLAVVAGVTVQWAHGML